MNTFIAEITQSLLQKHQSFEKVKIVLPSERAKVFLKKELKQQLKVGFIPEILSIEQFIKQISKLESIDTLTLLFHFYTVYKKHEVMPVSFDVFSGWATTVLQDFNEIDQHLVDTKDIFAYVRDIQRLRKWSVKGEFQETDLIKDHHLFLEKLNDYYQSLTNYLLDKGIGYQGLIYRQSCERLSDYLAHNKEIHFYFVGFNALNKAEEHIFKSVLATTSSEIYWDIDELFLKSNHQAGKFIRKYQKEWAYFEKKELKIIGTNFTKPKHIEVIGASKNITQVKYAAEQISKIKELSNTAMVLSDETLLPICINSLPNNVAYSNITMGYPLKDVPVTHFFYILFQLFISQIKLNKVQEQSFYYQDINAFCDQPFLRMFIPEIQRLKDVISRENKVFVSKHFIHQFFDQNIDKDSVSTVKDLFEPFSSIIQFLDRIVAFIDLIKQDVTPLEKEYLFRYFRIFNQLRDLECEFQYFPDLKTLYSFFRQLVQSETLSFSGEPLSGLQIMGMLETRALDFENIVLVSANEGILPANSHQNSFIPFDVKIHFGLPTYKEKDAIFSYHFFRLLQRATSIFIIYNTETDAFGKGEKSRFVTQLEKMREDVQHKMITPKIITSRSSLQKIEKSAAVLEELKQFAKKGISPSSITNYLNNPIKFYKQKVLKIRELDDVEETVAANTLGNVVHNALEKLYEPFEGKYIHASDLKKIQSKVADVITYFFKEENFSESSLASGKNRLIFEVAKKFVSNFLHKEFKALSIPGNQLKIIAREQRLSHSFTIEGFDFPIKLHGVVDRVDEFNGQLRIIDYKTGTVIPNNLKVGDFENIREYDKHKAIQVLLYTYLYTQHQKHAFKKPIQAGIFSMKKLSHGFMKVDFSTKSNPNSDTISKEHLDEFLLILKDIIKEIFDPSIPFEENKDAKY